MNSYQAVNVSNAATAATNAPAATVFRDGPLIKKLSEDLQGLMKSPLIDPFKDQLAKLRPGDKLIVKNITFYKNNNEIVVLAKTKHHENFNGKRTVATVVPSNPI
jgi:hypothetical protein